MAAEKKSTQANWVRIIERAPSRAQKANGEGPPVLALRIRVQAIGQIGVKVTVAVEKVQRIFLWSAARILARSILSCHT